MRKWLTIFASFAVLYGSDASALVSGSSSLTVSNGSISSSCTSDQVAVGGTCKSISDCDLTSSAVTYDTSTHAFSCNTGMMQTNGGDYGSFTCTSGTCSVDSTAISNSMIANSTIDLTAKVTGTLPVANGGTGAASYAAKGDILVSSGTTTLTKLGVGTDTYVLTADSAQATGVKYAKPSYPVLLVQSDVTINITTSGTKYISLTGNTSATEADVVSPIPAGTYTNLACTTNADQTGRTITVAWGDAACTSAMSYSSRPSVTVSSTANTMSSVSTTTTAISGDDKCAVLKVTVSGGTMVAGYMKCRLEKTL